MQSTRYIAQIYSQNILITLWLEVSLVTEQIHSSQSSFNWFPIWNGNYFTTGKTWDNYPTKMHDFYLHWLLDVKIISLLPRPNDPNEQRWKYFGGLSQCLLHCLYIFFFPFFFFSFSYLATKTNNNTKSTENFVLGSSVIIISPICSDCTVSYIWQSTISNFAQVAVNAWQLPIS